ncbi:hypothetical protein GC163_19570 [bacterium]|nr:hypothetical protein [bacterium]
MTLLAVTAFILQGFLAPVRADGPADNSVENVRRVPKLGVEVPEADRIELEAGLQVLQELMQQPLPGAGMERYWTDVEIFHRAVDQALKHQEFFDAKEIPVAKKLLALGKDRAEQLIVGNPAWIRQTGLVVRGYRSKIDNTVQPYGLIVPDDYDFNIKPDDQQLPLGVIRTRAPSRQPMGPRHRLDLWFHGRGETLSEVNFINQRLSNRGEFTPPGTIVLHPYGRYCNANKFAGEIDTFEALAHAKQNYRIDDQHIAVRGFSMGGAACWQFAVHYPGKWFAANPGAGFSETPDFLKVFQKETLAPTWYEEKLWRMYDCTDYAANLAFLPTVAYSGEIDSQKQAADIMEVALKAEGLPLLHIIGPMTAHKIHPDSKIEIEKTLSQWERLGPPYQLKSPLPFVDGWETIDQFVTYTLRYNQSRFITAQALEEHWEPARIVVQRHLETDAPSYRVTTHNVRAFALDLNRMLGGNAFNTLNRGLNLEIDGQRLPLRGGGNPQGFEYIKTEQGWISGRPETKGLAKRHGLQGPIDDAFMESYIFVKPTSTGLSPEIDAWVTAEFEHAVEHWRRHFRGDARIKLDTEITKEDMQSANIVLWGDPKSNETLRFIQDQLPIRWNLDDQKLLVGATEYDAATHLPLMIFPNPLAPNHYVVLNSSFTFREYDYLNNARQSPKLPDWAIIDVRTPANSRYPGNVVDANFFDETWQLKPAQ